MDFKNRNSLGLIFYYTILMLLVAVITLPFIGLSMPVLKGIFLGYVFTVLKLFLMERILISSLKKEPSKAASYVKLHYFFRFLLTFLILLIAFVDKGINEYVVVVLFLLLKPAAYIYGLKTKDSGKEFEIVEYDDDEYDEFGDF